MSANTDFSQFRRASGQSETTNQDPVGEFAQFKRAPKRGAYETFVERPGQIALQSAVAGARAIPRTGYDLLKSVVSATGGDLSKLESAEENAPEWLKKFGNSAFPTYEEVREDQRKTGKTYGDKKPLAQPEGAVERGIEKFGRFVGESPALGGVGGVRGLAALGGLAGGMQVGEESNLGPIGQLVTGAIGAAVPSGARGLVKAIASPRQTAAKAVARTVPASKASIQKQIIQEARDAGVQLDLGSITDSGAIKFVQNQLAQSALSGPALENFKKQLSRQVIEEYRGVADAVGRERFRTNYEAGESVQQALRTHRDRDLSVARDLYSSARKRGGDFQVFTGKVGDVVKELEESLAPGSIKSGEQQAVLNAVQKLKSDVMTPQGTLKSASINDLINDKIALNDIIDYEVQGGAKQLLKRAVKALDETIAAHGAQDPTFAREWKSANKRFADHAKTFRNQNISNALKTQDPSTILNKMNTVQGIKDVKKALSGTKEGKDLFADLSRHKLDDVFQKGIELNAKDQLQFGRFSNVLKDKTTRSIIEELLPAGEVQRLDRLMRTSGNIAESATKFLNTSQSGTTLINFAAAAKILRDFSQIFAGNFLPALQTGTYWAGANGLSKLITSPTFLKAVEDAVLAAKSGNQGFMREAANTLVNEAKKAGATASRGAGSANQSDREQRVPASQTRQIREQTPLGAP